MSQRRPEQAGLRAIQPLAVLPVFFDLHDKTVLLAGAEEGAEWKLDLLAAAGARVRLVTSEPTPEMLEVARARAELVTHESRDWRPSDLEGIALALGAFEEDEDAARFAAAARAAGVPVNVIDNKPYCDFQFGSIVNRSPVVVSISTAGAAPAIAQAVRQRIEALLPLDLAGWGQAAMEARARIMAALPDKAARKAFWRDLAEAAFLRPAAEAASFIERAGRAEPEAAGHVTLVGAGPGAADLLTIRAVRAMQAADVILFDDLVSDEVLDLARREAKRMMVGKRGHRASCRQEDINALMVKLAKQGKRVVRLKSGDPMIFGRAGEEIAALAAERISVEVVPGVTAALAAASSLGVSLTHRDCAQGVKFVTAHSREGRLPDLDWRACADPKTTLIVYMGGRTAPVLAERLIAEGLPATTPIIVVEAASRPDEHRRAGTLDELRAGPIEADGPVLLGIGQTFAGVLAVATPTIADRAA